LLGQLIGYDDRAERKAVLKGGLIVHGIKFAKELSSLTKGALEGFWGVPGGADGDLTARIEEIDERVNEFVRNS